MYYFDNFNHSYEQVCYSPYEEAIKLLDDGIKEFVNYPLALSELEEYHLDMLKINQTTRYSYDYQFNNGDISTGIILFLQSIGNTYEVSLSVAKLTEKLVVNIMNYHNRSIALLRINAYNPSDNEDTFELPRWHFDRLSFKEFSYKNVVTLKGSKTLFVELPLNVREEFNFMQKYVDSKNYTEVQLASTNIIKQCINNKVCSLHYAKHKWATVFSVGNEFSALHSEPMIYSERLFLSIK